MKTIRRLLPGLLLLITANTFAQEPVRVSPLKTAGFTAQFLISTDFKATYLNFVGGSIKYTSGVSSISLTVFPSLRFGNAVTAESSGEPKVVPGLAVGPMFTNRRLMVAVPVFYHGEWQVTAGVGIKIGK